MNKNILNRTNSMTLLRRAIDLHYSLRSRSDFHWVADVENQPRSLHYHSLGSFWFNFLINRDAATAVLDSALFHQNVSSIDFISITSDNCQNSCSNPACGPSLSARPAGCLWIWVTVLNENTAKMVIFFIKWVKMIMLETCYSHQSKTWWFSEVTLGNLKHTHIKIA